MLTQEQRMQLSDVLRPVSPPREVDNVYTDEQRETLLDVVRTQGPWRLIIAQHFASPEELMATMSGALGSIAAKTSIPSRCEAMNPCS